MIILSTLIFVEKYYWQNVSEIEFQIPIVESEINEKYRNVYLRIRKTHITRGTEITTNILLHN